MHQKNMGLERTKLQKNLSENSSGRVREKRIGSQTTVYIRSGPSVNPGRQKKISKSTKQKKKKDV